MYCMFVVRDRRRRARCAVFAFVSAVRWTLYVSCTCISLCLCVCMCMLVLWVVSVRRSTSLLLCIVRAELESRFKPLWVRRGGCVGVVVGATNDGK